MKKNMTPDIRNHCETLVFDLIKSMPAVFDEGADFVNDVVCVALNRLRPRYIREPIYLFFHMTDSEWEAINAEVAEAVDFAVNHMGKNLRYAGLTCQSCALTAQERRESFCRAERREIQGRVECLHRREL